MFTKDEFNPKKYTLTEEQDKNLDKLLIAMNKIRAAYGKPMIVTSGVRSMEDQMRINPKAPKSKHLLGLAVDIADKDKKLKEWLLNNVPELEIAGLYCENFEYTESWVHFQCLSPKSGRRFFIP